MSILKGKTAIITGAANGIGEQLTKDFLAAGAKVIACDRDFEVLKSKFEQKEGCKIYDLDVTDYDGWKHIIDDVNQLDYLLNVAGIIQPAKILSSTKASIDAQIDINLKATIYGSQLAAQKMAIQGNGHIVNIASLASLAPLPGIGIYGASKFGVRGFTLALHNELESKGVMVSVVCPDATDTQMMDAQMEEEEAALAFTAPHLYTVKEVSNQIIKEVIEGRKIELWIPFNRGVQAYLGAAFPRIAKMVLKRLVPMGKKMQASFKRNRKK